MKKPRLKLSGEKIFDIEKRIILAFLMLFIGSLIARQVGNLHPAETAAPLKKKIQYMTALGKIREGDNWKPQGLGSQEDLATLPKISAGTVIDFDLGQVLWSRNFKQKIAPASLAKLATAMTALDIAAPSKLITISQTAADQIPTKLALKVSEKITLDEAIAAIVLTSANDAAEALSGFLGDEIGNGTPTFMGLVNKKLGMIGASDSHFVTSTGLDAEDQYSTVYDLLIIAHEAKTNYPLISKLATLEYQKLPADTNHRLIDLPNWNALLGTYPGVDGLKIGYSEAAGYATIVTAKRDSKYLMAIVIGAKSLEEREIAAATLLNFGFSKFNIQPFPVSELNLVKRYQDWQRQLSLAN